MDSPQPNVFAAGGLIELPIKFWAVTALTGFGAGLAGGALMLLLRLIQHVAWSYWTGEFLDGVQKSSSARRLAVVALAGALVIVGRLALKAVKPASAGDVSAAIWFKAGRMPFLATVGRAIHSIVLVALGASLGREGAPKQVGAAIASTLADRSNLNNSQRRLLVASGVGAGIAAVYNVPFGGALFALEVLLGTLALPMVAPALLASLIATTTAWLLLPNVATYQTPHFGVSTAIFAGALALGAVSGGLGALWIWLVAKLDDFKPRGVGLIIAPIVAFVALGLLSLRYPQLLGNGKDVVQLTLVSQATAPILLALLFLKPLATLGCLGSGAPGGLFTPTLSIGAIAGGIFGFAWTAFWPGPPAGLFALVGAAAFLAASTKGPVSSTVLMLELTRHIDPVMAPLMLAVAAATLVSRACDSRSIYSAHIRRAQAAVGPSHPPAIAGSAAPQIHHPTVMSAATPYAAILKRLLGHPGAPVYVLDEHGKLIGEITPHQAAHAESFASPLEVALAFDLVSPVAALVQTRADASDVAQAMRLRDEPYAPVVSAHDGAFLGVIHKPIDE